MELLLLRRHYGITAREYLHILPEWEVDLLLVGLPRPEAIVDDEKPDEAPVRDPRVPSSFWGDE